MVLYLRFYILQTEVDAAKLQALSTELSAVYDRMNQIGVHTAEARAATILSGLQVSLLHI